MHATVSSGSHLEPLIGFSRAVRSGPHIVVAGTAPIGDDGETAAKGDVYGQTVRCLQIIETALGEAGGRLEDIVRTRIMLTDISTWREAAWAHGEFFGEIRPACTFVQVVGFIEPDWLVEIEADAIVASLRDDMPESRMEATEREGEERVPVVAATAQNSADRVTGEGEAGAKSKHPPADHPIEGMRFPWQR